jgi:regulation of enolase protein 1 (concanavalin A-like superfamily)
VTLRVRREGSDYLVEADAGEGWSQIRMARLLEDRPCLSVQAGLYVCSPIASGFKAHFETLTIDRGRLG